MRDVVSRDVLAGQRHRRHNRRRELEVVHREPERVVVRRSVRLLLLLRVEIVAEEHLGARARRDGAAHPRREVRQANLVRGWEASQAKLYVGREAKRNARGRDAPFIQPKPSLGTILKSTPWLPYSASTR